MKIGVIGAGTMGQGIAKAFAQVEGNTVALCDIKQEWAENGLAKIKKGYEKLVAKGKMTQEKADAIVAAITPGLKEDHLWRAGQDLQARVRFRFQHFFSVHHRDRQGR